MGKSRTISAHGENNLVDSLVSASIDTRLATVETKVVAIYEDVHYLRNRLDGLMWRIMGIGGVSSMIGMGIGWAAKDYIARLLAP